MTKYRAEIKLSTLTDQAPDNSGYVRTNAETTVEFTVTAATVGDAVRQMYAHAVLLAERYDDTPDPDTARSAASDSEECPF